MDFIEVYEDARPADACAEIVRAFEASGAAVPGRVGGGVMPDLKDSGDIHITGRPEWREAENALNHAVFAGLLKYLRTYRHALIAPLMLQIQAPDGTMRRIAAEDFDFPLDEPLVYDWDNNRLAYGVCAKRPLNFKTLTIDELRQRTELAGPDAREQAEAAWTEIERRLTEQA